MTVIDANRMHEIETRYPEYFHQSFRQRFGGLMILIATLLYSLYAVWFFDLPKLFVEAHWERVGIYLSQWVSYDVQPEFRIEDDGSIDIRYPRFSPLGDNPNPDWLVNNPDGSITVSISGTSRTVTVSKSETIVTAYGVSVPVDVFGGAPKVVGPVPGWMTVYDDNVLADLGFAGNVSISVDRVKMRKRFIGWANFIFDTQSSFFDKPVGEVVSLIVSGPRIKPDQSNLSLAFDDIWNNSEWQHGDVWTKLFQTIVMAFLGTLLGSLTAFPLAFLAARNITPNRLLNQVLKRFFDFLRSVDMLIWALFLTRAFGPGPLAGSGAIFLTETGTLGKLYSEGLENIDNKPREGIKSTGAQTVLVHRYGIMPQIVPVFVSQTLYQWESNVRGATIIGAVGAGGIGLKLWEAMRTNANWENVAYMVILILIVVFIFDTASNALRHRLMGTKIH
ncbi:phosphonate ABC transporter, permease protein PhnE [Rhizobium ruizarguesonis]|uniref:phosphonate ABC transporter, permease protein PhnE n=1 Tax=Rhizobium ruizarguesonis TaxID=2081791 RepID=UPI0010304DC2|nr:phosphonate ABC transporter, permease protein PhnE [Rhizobium ruizarguesonis]QIJ42972.1 phosphonate ABC transporter, permease protein PhnE [Rhizobium leguminosarum]NEH29123.1 phosphonate ABC transporter, permease protein PhnE [Rhizobium ruizarguesonis]NEJ08952.1 phosphonate ABC transporter, permease protein PhnE [Rhizobium ruizarguesonis]NEK07072.1 phosphonate ABC transporter, permease protein PhnE [Rhizobium ruizarguesonis]TAU12455.1 phosphonate ABC transporter, permease protein PhnE [Rhiz